MRWRAPIIVGLVVGLGAVSVNVVAGSLACGFDTSYCAESSAQSPYRGRIFSYDGRPVKDAVFELWVNSFEADQPRLAFRTDAYGRFCVMWVSEYVDVALNDFSSDAPVDSRFVGREGRLRLRKAHHPGLGSDYARPGLGFMLRPRDDRVTLATGPDTADLWIPQTDLTSRCQATDERPAWYRFEGLRSSWQYMLLLVLPLASMGLLVGALALGPVSPAARVLRLAGVVGSLGGGLLFLILWNIL